MAIDVDKSGYWRTVKYLYRIYRIPEGWVREVRSASTDTLITRSIHKTFGGALGNL